MADDFIVCSEITLDNNLAERAIRLAVTKRKVGGGSRNMARFEDTANLRSCHSNLSFSAPFCNGFFYTSFNIAVLDSVKYSNPSDWVMGLHLF